MATYLTPGVYFERPQPQVTPLPLRTDVTGFVGIAERGPLHQPQRLTNWREFQQVFGGFLPYAYLAYAVHAFFENGGQVCWVVRVAATRGEDQSEGAAQVASVEIPDEESETAFAYVVEAANPGTWGNDLAISLQADSLAVSQHVAKNLPSDQLAVARVSGFEEYSDIRLTQAGVPEPVTRTITKVDVIKGILYLNQGITEAGFDHVSLNAAPIQVESLDFRLLVRQSGQVVERFNALAANPDHPSRYALNVVNNTSAWIRLKPVSDKRFPQLPWQGILNGGANGLRRLSVFDYVGRPDDREKRGLATLSEKDEVSILAIPDLTASSGQPEEPVRASRPRINQCSLSTPVQRRSIAGRVFDAATVSPNNLPGLKALAGVEIQLDDGLTEHEPQKTDKGGHFEFPNLLPGQVELLVTLGGYKVRIVRISVKPGIGIQELADIVLTPIEQPSALSEADIFYAQAAMIQQCELLRDRVAILDPPWPSVNEPEDINRLQAWRSRFETAFAALYYPWLVIRDPLQPTVTPGKLMPASGHIAGIYAATDLAEGVFRPPANKMLRFVEDVGTKVDDALQGVLNPKGINVIRAFPGRGIRVFGARTLSSNTAWRFVNVRRLMNFLEEAIDDGLQWAVFEPNNEQLWFGIRLFLTTFLDNLWRQGALVGDTTEAAYQVRCDAVTTTPDAQAAGQVIAEVSVAPTIPYEFIVFRLGLTMDELKISEVSP
jgi:hypothetical protein